jgi:hypothetical protein
LSRMHLKVAVAYTVCGHGFTKPEFPCFSTARPSAVYPV